MKARSPAGGERAADEGTTLDVGALLTIDVDAELRRLADSPLEGPWQVPAELTRRALASGAGTVEVRLGASAFSVTDDGSGIDAGLLRRLAALLDQGAPPQARHRALLELESGPSCGLIALAGLRPARLSIETQGGGARRSLRFAPGRGPEVRTLGPAEGHGASIVLEGVRADAGRARAWLESVCRFAPAPVIVDGRPVPAGFTDTLAEAPLAPPLRGRVALRRHGDTARVYLLLDGVVSAHASLAEAPAFEAVVEMRGLVARAAGPAALREAMAPHIERLINEAVRLGLSLAAAIREHAEPDQRRIRRLLLDAAQRRARRSEVMSAPIFRALVGPRGGERWLSLLELGRAAEGSGGGALYALYPEQDPARYLLPPRPVFVLDADERGRLAVLLGLSFRPPEARAGGRPLPRLRAFLQAARGLARAAGRLLDLHPSAPLEDAALSDEERAFLAAVRPQLGSAFEGIDLCPGRGPIRRSRRPRPRLLLPRENPVIRACVRATSRDPAWAYPAALVALEGRSLPEARARSRWHEQGSSGNQPRP